MGEVRIGFEVEVNEDIHTVEVFNNRIYLNGHLFCTLKGCSVIQLRSEDKVNIGEFKSQGNLVFEGDSKSLRTPGMFCIFGNKVTDNKHYEKIGTGTTSVQAKSLFKPQKEVLFKKASGKRRIIYIKGNFKKIVLGNDCCVGTGLVYEAYIKGNIEHGTAYEGIYAKGTVTPVGFTLSSNLLLAPKDCKINDCNGYGKCKREDVKERNSMVEREFRLEDEYSLKFDKIRKGMMEQSFYKYGPLRQNYTQGYLQAIPSLENCLKKYKETGNTEYLCDLANYAMIEYMFPQHEKGHFRHTSSEESAGVVGMSCRECDSFKE